VRISRASVCAALLWVPLVGCARGPAHEVAAERKAESEDVVEGRHPVLRAQVIRVLAGATISATTGGCFVIREDTGTQNAAVGEVLHDDDLLELGDACSLTIKAAGMSDIKLARENGRFFRLVVERTE
jgi:hypothetical protein